MISVEKTGKTVVDAILAALIELDVDRDNVEIEVIEEGSKGFLGLVGSRLARVRVTVKPSRVDKARAFLERVIELLGVEATVDVEQQGEYTVLQIEGNHLGILIGRRGETLDALQYLTNLAANRDKTDQAERVRVILDAEGYRKRRENTLRNLAYRLAEKVKREKRRAALEPMSPLERRIIHTALQDDESVETYSEGEEPFRRVVIAYKG
ncbi:MAG TPA: RNA-binding cell elongation regulator Jag/EloR [Bacillota bacterium]|mgnify:FL=1|nr:RNA-binding cell elongation regulator Jag/EloR [Bacillota bacterium]HQD18532.1 RNA-binding cell elongation regulator Jag/EloR [Bacillota bacterium]